MSKSCPVCEEIDSYLEVGTLDVYNETIVKGWGYCCSCGHTKEIGRKRFKLIIGGKADASAKAY